MQHRPFRQLSHPQTKSQYSVLPSLNTAQLWIFRISMVFAAVMFVITKTFVKLVTDKKSAGTKKKRAENAEKENGEFKRQNQELTEKFNVRGFPCAVLCDAEGTEIKRFGGYRKGGPSAYLEMLEDAVKDLPKPKGKAVSADDPPVCAIWVVRLRPGALEKYRALFNSVAQKVRETEGCEAFMLLQDVQTKAKGQARPRTALTCIEKWQSRSAFEANRASDAMKEFDAQAARLRYGADLYVASELVEP